MDQFIRYPITFYVVVDLCLMVAVIAQRIKHLGQHQMRQVLRYLLRHNTQSPYLGNSSYRRACSFDDWLTTEDILIAHDVIMTCGLHADAPSLLSCPLLSRTRNHTTSTPRG